MRHDISIVGYGYRIRPISDFDARLLVTLRGDPALSRFLHPTPLTVASQQDWLKGYFDRLGDYYFVIERKSDGVAQGVISIYDVNHHDSEAEWGRWIIKSDSLASIESVALIYRCAFDVLELRSIYCRTVAENTQVVAFHDSCGYSSRAIIPGCFQLGADVHDAVEHRIDRETWADTIAPRLDGISKRIAGRLSRAEQ